LFITPGITDDDAIKLEAAGYTTKALLERASREGLEQAGLKAAKVDYVMHIKGAVRGL
jgi:hypothetical protein